jgi:hypothetical protein
MPDSRTHRGPHPEDAKFFAAAAWPVLRQAAAELGWLLSHGYAPASSLKLVGDRHQLSLRQRSAIERGTCADLVRASREARRASLSQLEGRTLCLDGYNVLTTVEVALAGGVVLACRDGTYRDIASMHGTFRKVTETLPALDLLGRVTEVSGAAPWIWYFDRPVSNSGRLKKTMEKLAAERGWPWRIELVPDPDAVLSATADVIATADSVVLDRCRRWCNLVREVVDRHVPEAHIVRLGDT